MGGGSRPVLILLTQGGGGGPKLKKTCWRNTWMVPYGISAILLTRATRPWDFSNSQFFGTYENKIYLTRHTRPWGPGLGFQNFELYKSFLLNILFPPSESWNVCLELESVHIYGISAILLTRATRPWDFSNSQFFGTYENKMYLTRHTRHWGP